MEFVLNDSITVWHEDIDLTMYKMPSTFNFLCPRERICIRGRWFDVIPIYQALRTRAADGYFRYIYIQINFNSGEFYIGKVNREKVGELKRYQGSGVLFKLKYKKHSEEFVRYYIAQCNSAKETEALEAEIVNEDLLKDPFCLNKVAGGGGTTGSYADRSQMQRDYMKKHPERYKALLEASKKLYLSGDTEALRKRSKKIKDTMSSDYYAQMTQDRILNWKERDPEGYKKARENNRLSVQKPETKEKRKKSRAEWKKNNPELYQANKEKCQRALHTPAVEKKRSEALKKWSDEHPEQVIKRTTASAEACRKKVNMLDLETGAVLKTFKSQVEAAEWLVEKGYAKSINCKTSISSVCLKRPSTTGYGYRKKAYGFGWEFAE